MGKYYHSIQQTSLAALKDEMTEIKPKMDANPNKFNYY
jgi:hypothetical protein